MKLPLSQIIIPTPFQVGPVNIYLIQDEKNILVDCGPKTEEAFKVLEQGLQRNGLTIADIDEIWLTHAHPDHFGLARRLQQLKPMPVYLHPDEKPNLQNRSHFEDYQKLFAEGGVPEHLMEVMKQQRMWYANYFDVPEDIHWLSEGQTLSSGKHDFEVLLMPGHSPGHVAFQHNIGAVIAGDVLIEHVTSNALIAFNPDGSRRDSLQRLRNSLKQISKIEGPVYAGHGRIISNPAKIATQHITAQDERYAQILAFINDTPQTWYEITRKIFPKSNRQDYTFLTLSETIGYLDRAIRKGDVRTEYDGTFLKYLSSK